MFADACTDLQGAAKALWRSLNGILVVKPVDDAEFARKHFVPILHEVVADGLLLPAQRLEGLWPGGLAHNTPRWSRQFTEIAAFSLLNCEMARHWRRKYPIWAMRSRP